LTQSGQRGLDLVGDGGRQIAIAASDLAGGGEQGGQQVVLSGSLGFDVIVPLQGFLDGLLGVFAGEDKGLGGQAGGQPGLVGMEASYICHWAVTLATIGSGRSFFYMRTN